VAFSYRLTWVHYRLASPSFYLQFSLSPISSSILYCVIFYFACGKTELLRWIAKRCRRAQLRLRAAFCSATLQWILAQFLQHCFLLLQHLVHSLPAYMLPAGFMAWQLTHGANSVSACLLVLTFASCLGCFCLLMAERLPALVLSCNIVTPSSLVLLFSTISYLYLFSSHSFSSPPPSLSGSFLPISSFSPVLPPGHPPVLDRSLDWSPPLPSSLPVCAIYVPCNLMPLCCILFCLKTCHLFSLPVSRSHTHSDHACSGSGRRGLPPHSLRSVLRAMAVQQVL